MQSDVVFVVEIDGAWTVSHDADVVGSFRTQIEAVDAARLVACGIEDCRILVQPQTYASQPDWTYEDPHDAWDHHVPEQMTVTVPYVESITEAKSVFPLVAKR